MSLITRCPACRTMFKVVPDQLRISEGWVRCGQCEEIFDASVHMQTGLSAEGGASPEPADPPSSTLAALAPELNAAPADELDESTASTVVDFELSLPSASAAPVVDSPAATAALLPEGSAYGVGGPPPTESRVAPQAPEPTPSQAAELSFMRNARKSSRWHRPIVRAVLAVVMLLLVATLLLQVAVHERDRIVATEPGLKPWIEEVCLVLECKIGPLRQIENIAIETSSFTKMRGDVYRLSLTVKNNAPIDLSMPAVELSLTDTLDHALVRRVIKADELGVPGGVIPAASEKQSTLVLEVKTNGNSERVAGYRLLAFYP